MTIDHIWVSDDGREVAILGPAGFCASIDWEVVNYVAAIFAPLCPTRGAAVRMALWGEYLTWRERQEVRPCVSA